MIAREKFIEGATGAAGRGFGLFWISVLYVVWVSLAVTFLGMAQLGVRYKEDQRISMAQDTENLHDLESELARLNLALRHAEKTAEPLVVKVAEIDARILALKSQQKTDEANPLTVELEGLRARARLASETITVLRDGQSAVAKRLYEMRTKLLESKDEDSGMRITIWVLSRIPGIGFLLALPMDLLTLFLTLSMGGMGGTLYVTREFLKDAPGEKRGRSASWYLLHPFLGLVTALAVFAALKAGQLTVSANSTATELSPYFVAFLGIISGLLSEEAHGAIRRAGTALFGGASARERWAIGLGQAIADAKTEHKAMAADLQVSEDRLQEWISETKPVPEGDQGRIAAYLRLPARRLFTPDPPPTRMP